MAKRIAKKTNETKEEEAIKPIPIKVVSSKSSKTVAKKTAPKKVNPDEVVEPVKVPTKRTPKQEVSKVEVAKNIPISERIGPAKTKRMAEDKYIRVANNADIEKFKEMSMRIQNGTLQWAYFAADGDQGYHYYLVINK